MKKVLFNWSGGKDSALCLHHVKQANELDILSLVTSINTEFQRISMHGVRCDLLDAQAKSLGLPLTKIEVPGAVSMQEYDQLMKRALQKFQDEGVEASIFGDIFLGDLREYREKELAKVGLEGIFPLWKEPTSELVQEFISSGFKAIVVCVNDKYLDQSFVGREIDQKFLDDLPSNVDPCGENGEFHSFVYDGPIFNFPISCEIGEKVHRKYEACENPSPEDEDSYSHASSVDMDTGFWYCDLILL